MRKCTESGHHNAWHTNGNHRADTVSSDDATDTAGDTEVTHTLDMFIRTIHGVSTTSQTHCL